MGVDDLLRRRPIGRRIRAAMGSPWESARLYDGEYGRMDADLDLYLRLMADERPRGAILELGCGTGRVAVPLALAGHRVTGLDREPAMLRRARRRRRALPSEAAIRLRFSLQDMRDFRFPRPHAAAIVPFSGLNLLATRSDRAACLECLADALAGGAPLVLDLASPGDGADRGITVRAASRFLLPPHGHVVDKLVEQRLDLVRGVVCVEADYRVHRWVDGVEVDRLKVRFDLARIERREIESDLFAAGFDVEAVWGGYRGTPYRPGHPRLIVVARRLA
jgi:SAM-dependent methyltransferase